MKTQNRTITATPNHSAKTFTIRTSTGSKYRTTKMNRYEFNDNLHNTNNDWEQFLKGSDYYPA